MSILLRNDKGITKVISLSDIASMHSLHHNFTGSVECEMAKDGTCKAVYINNVKLPDELKEATLKAHNKSVDILYTLVCLQYYMADIVEITNTNEDENIYAKEHHQFERYQRMRRLYYNVMTITDDGIMFNGQVVHDKELVEELKLIHKFVYEFICTYKFIFNSYSGLYRNTPYDLYQMHSSHNVDGSLNIPSPKNYSLDTVLKEHLEVVKDFKTTPFDMDYIKTVNFREELNNMGLDFILLPVNEVKIPKSGLISYDLSDKPDECTLVLSKRNKNGPMGYREFNIRSISNSTTNFKLSYKIVSKDNHNEVIYKSNDKFSTYDEIFKDFRNKVESGEIKC